MTQKTKHTPTPWKVDDWYGDTQIIGSDQSCVCTDTEFYPVAPSVEDMNHIVKCVNLHDELVSVLGDIHDFLKRSGYDTNLVREVLKKAGAL